MNKKWCSACVLSIGMAAAPLSNALADSDGYFCIGEGYLAYEMAFSIPIDGHQLYVLTAADEQIAAQRSIRLPDFQLQTMRCSEDTVILHSATATYAVDLISGTASETFTQTSRHPADPPNNLVNGHWVRRGKETGTRVIELPGWPEDATYELHIVSYERPSSGSIQHYTISHIARIDRYGFVDTQLIYSGAQLETID